MEIVESITRFVKLSAGMAGMEEDEDFDALALAAFAFQYERSEPFRRLCDARGVRPGSISNWRDVPAVPTTAYRTMELHTAPPVPTAESTWGTVKSMY